MNDIRSSNLVKHSVKQFSFRSAYSTMDQLLLIYNYSISHLNIDNNKKVVDLIFFYYGKAFERVNHIVLLTKLPDIGIESENCNLDYENIGSNIMILLLSFSVRRQVWLDVLVMTGHPADWTMRAAQGWRTSVALEGTSSTSSKYPSKL